MARIASSGRGIFLWVDLPEGMDTMGYLTLFFAQNSGSHIKTAPPNMSVPFTSIRFFNFNIQAPRLNLTRLV